MSEAKNLQKELLWDFPVAYKNKDNDAEAVNAFAEKYKVYLDFDLHPLMSNHHLLPHPTQVHLFQL